MLQVLSVAWCRRVFAVVLVCCMLLLMQLFIGVLGGLMLRIDFDLGCWSALIFVVACFYLCGYCYFSGVVGVVCCALRFVV